MIKIYKRYITKKDRLISKNYVKRMQAQITKLKN